MQYEGESALHSLGALDPGRPEEEEEEDDDVAKTFELTLTLRQGQPATWGQRVARRISSSFSSFSSSSSHALPLSTSYRLVKRRKYRDD